MGIRVEKYLSEMGFVYDDYENADSWFLASNGELQIYLGVIDADDQSKLMAEYGAGQFVRVFRNPLPEPEQKREDSGGADEEDERYMDQ